MKATVLKNLVLISAAALMFSTIGCGQRIREGSTGISFAQLTQQISSMSLPFSNSANILNFLAEGPSYYSQTGEMGPLEATIPVDVSIFASDLQPSQLADARAYFADRDYQGRRTAVLVLEYWRVGSSSPSYKVYANDGSAAGSASVNDGVFSATLVDMESAQNSIVVTSEDVDGDQLRQAAIKLNVLTTSGVFKGKISFEGVGF